MVEFYQCEFSMFVKESIYDENLYARVCANLTEIGSHFLTWQISDQPFSITAQRASERAREIEWMGLGTRAFFNYFLYYHARNAELFHGT